MSVSVFAPAKINLSLHVGSPRADGRHPLASVIAFADVGDRLTLARGPARLAVHGLFAEPLLAEAAPEANLVTRALAVLGVTADIELEKRLPLASGIGGGSADAAAALRGANLLHDLRLAPEDLEARGFALGADVPACVRCRPAFMTGAGETLSDLILPALSAVLVNPGAPAPTGAVYRLFDEMGLGGDLSGETAPVWTSADAAIAGLVGLRNDLEAPACRLAPIISVVLARLRKGPGVRLARMSGSGATCFALVDAAGAAQALTRALRAERPDWWVIPVTLSAIDAAPRAL
jgi:4-diphosphocytidyl-2-C-methyl-D-erythritol kinase